VRRLRGGRAFCGGGARDPTPSKGRATMRSTGRQMRSTGRRCVKTAATPAPCQDGLDFVGDGFIVGEATT